ncbi:MAG TPA: Lrp/AsnC family transcriptional regulator [Acidobacteriota bacterium]|jgi:DNA-binding Lrp family transcriptional regulator|nr:Lrp/AsnC family transcriptional regulator [Acidobacteriota bacterium]HRR55581.1 Lrp/AsnC family transcriptional regulator [Acidobacteriota bacterium]HRV06904.1 Lrp/AsnC family transcriptional regulator [Acidobacteriota bacterium]
MDEILRILQENARESVENIARMLDLPVDEVASRIKQFEEAGVIRGYQAIVDEEKIGVRAVTAVIEVKVTPERRHGFDTVARRIAEFPEVRSLYLVSGTFDLLLFVQGSTLQEVAGFVSSKLAPMEGVTSTCTHFMLKTYKDRGLIMEPSETYEKLKISL